MYPKTPSSQQHAGTFLRRQKRHHYEQASFVSPPPNLIAVPAEESSSPFSLSSSSSSPISSSPRLIKSHQHQDDDNDNDDDVDYVYDTVIVKKQPAFFREAAASSLASLKTVLTVPLFVAICSIICLFPTRITLPQVKILFSWRHYYCQNGHAPMFKNGHYARVVYLEQLSSGEGGVVAEASPSIMNTTSNTIRSRKSSSSMNDTGTDKTNNNSNEHRTNTPYFVTTPSTIIANPMTTTKKRPRQQRRLVLDDESQEYDHDRPGVAAPEFETRDCKAQYQWQLDSRVTCNRIHEVDMMLTSFRHHQQQEDDDNNDHNNKQEDISSSPFVIRHLGSGFWRDAWIILDNTDSSNNINKNKGDHQQQHVVLKTMRYHHSYTPRNLDRHRRDAMTAEHFTKSPHIVDIYAHCGNSGFFEYGNGGDLEKVLGMNNDDDHGDDDDENDTDADAPNLLERFHIAVQAAMSLATLHNFDREGVSSIAHADITLGQFISVNGTIKLNDFNRARFIAWNETSKKPCPYYILNNPGFMRSPEEYRYGPQTEKVDVYSFGNVLYVLLMLEWPFYEVDYDVAEDGDDYSMFIGEQVIQGRRPSIPDEVWNSSNAIEKALVMSIRMCFEPDPMKRVSARQVETFLISQLEKIDPGRLETWRGGTSR